MIESSWRDICLFKITELFDELDIGILFHLFFEIEYCYLSLIILCLLIFIVIGCFFLILIIVASHDFCRSHSHFEDVYILLNFIWECYSCVHEWEIDFFVNIFEAFIVGILIILIKWWWFNGFTSVHWLFFFLKIMLSYVKISFVSFKCFLQKKLLLELRNWFGIFPTWQRSGWFIEGYLSDCHEFLLVW
jgi:hypothetical protein